MYQGTCPDRKLGSYSERVCVGRAAMGAAARTACCYPGLVLADLQTSEVLPPIVRLE